MLFDDAPYVDMYVPAVGSVRYYISEYCVALPVALPADTVLLDLVYPRGTGSARAPGRGWLAGCRCGDPRGDL